MASPTLTPIAVVGIGCRLPANVTNPEDLWTLLVQGGSAWSRVPADRFNDGAFYHPDAAASGSHNHWGGHFLRQNIAAFDAEFFGISHHEAQAMDPQQRLLLESTFDAFENGGLRLEDLRGSETGVYVAVFTQDYDRNIYKDPDNIPQYHVTGCGEAIISNRISYVFDLKGPSMTLDTGCSGGMVALHQACQSLRSREVEAAVAGGVNLILSPDHMIGMSNIRMLNIEGKSFSFDARGTGYGRGEGIACLVLKRLDDALQAKDPIRAIIRGTAVNQDGKTAGITLPSREAQEKLQRRLYQDMKIDPRSVGYVEAHGTGTVAGDLAEMEAIANVFCNEREDNIFVGSVKSNVGHLEGASGLAGVIKAILALEKGMIPPNINFEDPKPGLKLKERNITVPVKLEAWPDSISDVRRVAVNSFGYGGTNAHILLEEASNSRYIWTMSQQIEPLIRTQLDTTSYSQVVPSYSKSRLFVVSARSKKAVIAVIKGIRKWVSERHHNTNFGFQDLEYTLSCRRSMMPYRFSFVAEDNLELFSATENDIDHQIRRIPPSIRIAFLFTGQGAQWYAMGRELMSNLTFRESFMTSSKILQDFGASWNLIYELSLDEAASSIMESRISQPATTALQIALVDFLSDVGIQPQAVLGHSSGEIAAAYAAGFLSHRMALKVSYCRSLISGLCRKLIPIQGAMLMVGLGENDVSRYIAGLHSGIISIACINSPISTTVSGDEPAILELKSKLDSAAIMNRKLKVDIAYHSHHMQKISQEYLQLLANLRESTPANPISYISTVTATKKTENFNSAYWVKNLISTVRYSDAVKHYCQTLQDSSRFGMVPAKHILIEIGPHNALSSPTRQSIKDGYSSLDYLYTSTLIRQQDSIRSILNMVGKLFENGAPVNFDAVRSLNVQSADSIAIQDLPSYPWDHSKLYWHESRLSRDYRLRQHAYHDLLGVRITASTSLEPRWRHIIDIDRLPWLRHHVIDSTVVFPGSGYICMAIEAMRQHEAESRETMLTFVARDVIFSKALSIPPSPEKTEMQLSLGIASSISAGSGSTKRGFRVAALSREAIWYEHCRGTIYIYHGSTTELDSEPSPTNEPIDYRPLNRDAKYLKLLSSETFYQELATNGNFYGSSFATVTNLKISNRHGVSEMDIPDIASIMPANFMQPHIMHPAVLDAIMHSSLALHSQHHGSGSIMPTFIKEIIISSTIPNKPGAHLVADIDFAPGFAHSSEVDISVSHDRRQEYGVGYGSVIEISGLRLQSLGNVLENRTTSSDIREIGYRMVWKHDVDFLSSLLNDSPSPSAQHLMLPPNKRLDLLNKAALIYIDNCLRKIETGDFMPKRPHLKRLLDWMRIHRLASRNAYSRAASPQESEKILIETYCQGVEGQLVSNIGENLPKILKEEFDPFQLMLEGDVLFQFYTENGRWCHVHLEQYLDHLSFKDPHMSVLEIGGGTGSTTLSILERLSLHAQLERYDFTDVSTGLFDRAQRVLRKWSSVVQYKTLDIEHDPSKQGFSDGSYDLVVAANVVHATENIKRTLDHVHKLLRPGGKLVLVEVTKPQIYIGTVFGTLQGWWNGVDDGRKNSPLLSREQWRMALVGSSFNGLEVAKNDFDGPAQTYTMMVSTALHKETANIRHPEGPVHMIIEKRLQESRSTFLNEFQRMLENQGMSVSRTSWDAVTFNPQLFYVIFDNGEQPFLYNPTQETFEKISGLLEKGAKIFWISVQTNASAVRSPKKGLITGFARSSHAENEHLNLVTFDVQEMLGESNPALLKSITIVITKAFFAPRDNRVPKEREYIYRDGQVLIPRLIADSRINERLARAKNVPGSGLVPCVQSEVSPRLNTSGLKPNDLWMFLDNNTVQKTLDPLAVEVAVKTLGLSHAVVMSALGRVDPSSALNECAGIVTAVGSNVTHLKIGDRVCAWGGALCASRVHFHCRNVHHLPDSLSFTTGASLPVAFMTVYHTLVELAGLERGQTVLIHGAFGETGQAAIQVAEHIGATTFVTVSHKAQRAVINDRCKVPLERILVDRSHTFKRTAFKLTQGRGFDVILDCLTTESFSDIWECVTTLGTFIRITGLGARLKGQDQRISQDKNVTFISFDLATLAHQRPERTATTFSKVMTLFEESNLVPYFPVAPVPISSIGEAFRMVQGESQVRKVVLETSEGGMFEATRADPIPARLDGKATYVIAGGLGDFGQRLCRLLVRMGARNVLVLSRRALAQEKRLAIEAELQADVPDVRFFSKCCDISNENQVQELVLSLDDEQVPPVKGVIQATVALQDRTLGNMTLNDFETPLQSKVHGTNNLNNAFSKFTLDFFLMLSSLTAVVGTIGQANYAAGNSFQDALAHANADSKTKYLSLNIGMVEGAAVNSALIKKSLGKQGFTTIKPQELLSFFEFAITSAIEKDSCQQMVLGFDRDSLSQVTAMNATLRSAMFIHVRLPDRTDPSANATESGKYSDRSFKQAGDPQNDVESISMAIAGEISSLSAFSRESLDMNLPISELGVDSLMAIEMRNWISRQYGILMQASDIMDQRSILALASHLACSCTAATPTTPAKDIIVNRPEALGLEETQPAFEYSKLSILPLPELSSTMQLYLDSRQVFLSPSELKHMRSVIQKFMEPGGTGQELQRRLIERAENPQNENWQSDLYTNEVYLKQRVPIHPNGTFYLGHLLTRPVHHQARQAAVISAAAFKFKQKLEAGELERDEMNGEPLCQDTLHWLFNVTREPCIAVDQLRKYPGNDYLVALRRGHVFKIQLKTSGGIASVSQLDTAFHVVLNASHKDVPSVAALTADGRDSWAEMRRSFRRIIQTNADTIRLIEAAAFVVCLDDGRPETASERCNQFFLGDPGNRWSDKNLQFVVCENGVSALVGEHSMLDGVSARQLHNFVNEAILEQKFDESPVNNQPLVSSHQPALDLGHEQAMSSPKLHDLVEELICATNPVVESHIDRIRSTFKATFEPIEFARFRTTTFGSAFLRSHACPVKSGYQLVIQLACLIYYGYNPPSWETVTMARFYKGRVDWIQAMQPAAASFCAAARDESILLIELRRLFLKAAGVHANTMTKIARGHGFKAHLHCLLGTLSNNEPIPALFKDAQWEATKVPSIKKVKTDCLEGMMLQETAFFMPEPDCIFVHYEVEEDGCLFFVQAWPGRTKAICDALEEAARMIKVILESSVQ